MTWETFQIVADKVLAYGRTQAIDFAGMGEPTLNPNLPRFIEYFRGKIPTLITTNVSALTPRNIEKLIEAGLGTMIVSFNGADAATYELMMGGLSFERADRYLADLVQRAKGRMNVVANVSVTKQTRGKLNDMGVEQITFSLCHNRGGHLKRRRRLRHADPASLHQAVRHLRLYAVRGLDGRSAGLLPRSGRRGQDRQPADRPARRDRSIQGRVARTRCDLPHVCQLQ
jgi:hypothetical protein